MPKGTPKWKELMNNFEIAVRRYCWMSGAHPSTHADTYTAYKEAKEVLITYLKRRK